MSWEALRLTSRSPAELYSVLGPHGVSDLMHQAISTCWRELPADRKSFAEGRRAVAEVFDRNMRVWRAIKKASPEAFFQDLLPHAADGFMRQALVLCWMMMPRGHRSLATVDQVMTSLFERSMAAWDQDNQTFTKGPTSRAAKPKKAPTAKPAKAPSTKRRPVKKPAKAQKAGSKRR